MIHAIQDAYYSEARNPSDNEVLLQLATEVELDKIQFTQDINSTNIEQLLQDNFSMRQQLNVNSFPSLRLQQDGKIHHIEINYIDVNKLLKQIQQYL